ncbi:oxidoreductase [Methanobrevibacter sp. 87.7]|uniref:C-GCAxxG-C-C family protein n=1 Tax=Methanobrevibacter sp. 87.7 TaxID=387957 RepID=UPI000B506612|nr:C-GCAxxG-C-C family protein [Methanobrevibacter sp. 87.7]OWT33805.1 oxidoreductase [Methanobrevibacter sp. 87.7]
MDLNSKEIAKKIEDYREDNSCSQATLMGLCEDCDIDLETLSKLGLGFSGGIGGTFAEGTCGAITGAVMALGLLADEDDIKPMAKQLFNDFQNKYGSVKCGDISKNGEDKSPCVEVCLFAGDKVCELLKD